MEKAGPLNCDDLSRRLGKLTDDNRLLDDNRLFRPPSRSSTISPGPEDDPSYEIWCHGELVRAGCPPVVSVELFLDAVKKDAQTAWNRLGLWLDYEDKNCVMPPVFSSQIWDWYTFQQKWQWDNRGKFKSEAGLAAYLDFRRRGLLAEGEIRRLSRPDFDELHERVWKAETRLVERSGTQGFAAYKEAVERRLASHHFTQPYKLTEDPRQQDARTTWIEYLSYTYVLLDEKKMRMSAAEPRYQRAWDEFMSYTEMPLPTSTPEKELSVAREKISRLVQKTWIYRERERSFRLHERRAVWILEQLLLINKASGCKEKAEAEETHENDTLPLQRPLRKRVGVGRGVSILDPEAGAGKGSDTTMPDETTATPTTESPGPRRSKRLRAAPAAEKTLSSQIQPTAQGAQGT